MEIKLDQIATMAYSTKETVYETYRLACEARSVDGCFIECGVGAGAQLMAMVLANTGKDVFGFDSFEGIPMAGPHDGTQPGIGPIDPKQHNQLISSGVTVHSVENVMGNFEQLKINCPTLKLKRGWFQNTLPKWQPVPIALLRLDGDLYESTKVCLDYLYPSVSVGGVVIIDDYGLAGCRKAVHDYFGDDMPQLHGKGVVYFYKK